MGMIDSYLYKTPILPGNHPPAGHVSTLISCSRPAEVQNHFSLGRKSVLHTAGMLANMSNMLGTVQQLARGGELLQLVPQVDGGWA